MGMDLDFLFLWWVFFSFLNLISDLIYVLQPSCFSEGLELFLALNLLIVLSVKDLK